VTVTSAHKRRKNSALAVTATHGHDLRPTDVSRALENLCNSVLNALADVWNRGRNVWRNNVELACEFESF